MKTPAGNECKYFYGDYRRGRHFEECRLLRPEQNWTPSLCFRCPVPEINLANDCEYMQLTPIVKRRFLVGRPEVQISAYCKKCDCPVEEPHIGCGQCHPLPDIFVITDDQPDPST
jgi:hypothetical protein